VTTYSLGGQVDRSNAHKYRLDGEHSSINGVEAGHILPERRAATGGERTMYNIRLANDLYEWLRTTAFYQRTAMTAMIVAALTRAQANHVVSVTTCAIAST